jgi:hypothetical protein
MPSFTPRNPAWETRLRDDFTTERYMAYLDARLTASSRGGRRSSCRIDQK